MDPGGNAVFVWTRKDGTTGCGGAGCNRIETRRRSAEGALSAIQVLSPPGRNAGGARVGVDSNGNAVFVWSTRRPGCGPFSLCAFIQARAQSSAGALSALQNLSPLGDMNSPQVEVDPGGNAVFVWSWRAESTPCCSERVATRARSATGALSPIQFISAPDQHGNLKHRVKVDADGNALIVWSRDDGTYRRIESRARSAGGALSAVQLLSAPGQPAGYWPELALHPDGRAVFAWDSTVGIQGRARSAAGVLSPIQTLSGSGTYSRVAIDSGGNAVFAWARGDGTTNCYDSEPFPCYRIESRSRSATGALGATQVLSAPGEHAAYPYGDLQLAMDLPGNFVFEWTRDGCGGGSACTQVRYSLRGGSLSATETLSSPGQFAFGVALAVDPDGGLDPRIADAVAAWTRNDGTAWQVEVAVQKAPPPS